MSDLLAMSYLYRVPFLLAGISLESKTTNQSGQSEIDCGDLWKKFEAEGVMSTIPDKLDDAAYAVYHQYEGDFMQPFAYFIGCRIKPVKKWPEGLDIITVPAGNYRKFTVKGKMPGCISDV